MSQAELQTLLMNVQNTEREARKELSSASEEISALSARHAREVEELDSQIRKKERENRALEDELRDSREDLSREKENVRELKVAHSSFLFIWEAHELMYDYRGLWQNSPHSISRSMPSWRHRKLNRKRSKPKSKERC
jgi:kinesin family protein C1